MTADHDDFSFAGREISRAVRTMASTGMALANRRIQKHRQLVQDRTQQLGRETADGPEQHTER